MNVLKSEVAFERQDHVRLRRTVLRGLQQAHAVLCWALNAFLTSIASITFPGKQLLCMGLVLANCAGATVLLLKRLAASKLCRLPLHERLKVMCFIYYCKQLAAASLGAAPTLLQAAEYVEQLEPQGEELVSRRSSSKLIKRSARHGTVSLQLHSNCGGDLAQARSNREQHSCSAAAPCTSMQGAFLSVVVNNRSNSNGISTVLARSYCNKHETAEQWKGVDLGLQFTTCEACRAQSCLADTTRTVQSHSSSRTAQSSSRLSSTSSLST
jgi:hypothetical protein